MYELLATKIIRPCNFIGQHTDSNSDKPNLNGKNFRNGRRMTIVQWNCDNRVTHWFLIQTSRFYFYIESNRQFNNLQFLSSFNCWNSSFFRSSCDGTTNNWHTIPFRLIPFNVTVSVFLSQRLHSISTGKGHIKMYFNIHTTTTFSVFVTRTNRNDLFAIYGRRRAI